MQGISRSASVVLAYLMKYERLSLREAYDLVRARRTVADPRKAAQLQTVGSTYIGLSSLVFIQMSQGVPGSARTV